MSSNAMTTAAVQPYRNSREHLEACFEWLDMALDLVLRRFHRKEHDESSPAHEVHGWFMSSREAERLLSAPLPPDDEDQNQAVALAEFRRQIQLRREASMEQGVYLSLPHLAQLFRLSPIEETALVACLAAELDGRYPRLYGYLHDDLTRRCPTLDLISKVIAAEAEGDAKPRLLFSKNAPIFRWSLVQPAGEISSPGLTQGLVIDSRIAAFLLEIPDVDERIGSFVRRVNPRSESGDAHPYEEIVAGLQQIVTSHSTRPVAYFHGPAASEGRRIAAAVCRHYKLGLLRVHIGELLESAAAGQIGLADGLRRVYRDALLHSSMVYLADFDQLDDARASSCFRALERLLLEGSWLTFVEAKRFIWMPSEQEATVLPFDLDFPDYHARRGEWQSLAISSTPAEATPDELESLAARYRLTVGEIHDAYRLARSRAAMRGEENSGIRIGDLHWAARTRAHTHFGSLARAVTPRATWEDLILPEHTRQQLREISEQVRHRPTVLHDWGFDRRLSTGKGLYALFVGPSGTGKTLAAEVMANTLGLDLLKVDLSGVVSKYIGETEKNLDRIFQGAERSDSILFFDEADALFGKRSEVHDAHDRYANIEINYLLQRLEQFEGVVILATNLAQNIDEAFSRRIHFSVEFPFPNEVSRAAIWRAHLPSETPAAPDLDFGFLAKQYKIAGGNIRNIALNAAFLAAADGARLEMSHLLQATRREYEKMGKLWEDGKRASAVNK